MGSDRDGGMFGLVEGDVKRLPSTSTLAGLRRDDVSVVRDLAMRATVVVSVIGDK